MVMALFDEVKLVVRDVVQPSKKMGDFDANTALLGALPEFDSMAVVGIISSLEERFDFEVADEEIDAEVFETLGTLVAFVEMKLA